MTAKWMTPARPKPTHPNSATTLVSPGVLSARARGQAAGERAPRSTCRARASDLAPRGIRRSPLPLRPRQWQVLTMTWSQIVPPPLRRERRPLVRRGRPSVQGQPSLRAQALRNWRPLCPWSFLEEHAPRPVARHKPAPFDAPTRPDGVSRAPTSVDKGYRLRSARSGWRMLRSCLVVEKFAQIQSRLAQMALGRIDRGIGDLSNLSDTQLAFDLQQIGLALFAG
jgi:hypothetical protein